MCAKRCHWKIISAYGTVSFLPAPRSVTKSHETSIKVISVLSYLRFDIRFPLFFLCATTGWNGCDDSHSTNTQKERKKMNQIILTTPEELRAIVSERLADTGRAHPAEGRTRQPHAGCGCGGTRTARVPDFGHPPLQADRQGECAVPQVRKQTAVLPQEAARMVKASQDV